MFDYGRAMRLQLHLSRLVFETIGSTPGVSNPRFIMGLDSSYTGGAQIAVAVLYDAEKDEYAWRSHVLLKPSIPYVPGLLAFREAPGYIRLARASPIPPDLLIVDGHGLAHPRGFGIASHVGLVLDKPSIGVAKKHLYGKIVEKDGRKIIVVKDTPVGEVVKTARSEIYVSIGHKITLDQAVTIVRKLLAPSHKLPKPLQEADTYSKKLRNQYKKLETGP